NSNGVNGAITVWSRGPGTVMVNASTNALEARHEPQHSKPHPHRRRSLRDALSSLGDNGNGHKHSPRGRASRGQIHHAQPGCYRGGTPVTATVTLAAPAGGSGLTVSLSSSATSVATTATTLTVPANQTSASTTITTYPTGLNVNTLP